MLGGYMGKILFVDLTQGKITEESLPESVYRDFIGGIGLGETKEENPSFLISLS